MYFAYAWPKVLASGMQQRGDEPVVALELDAGLGCLAVVMASSIEIWSTGQHRRLIGRHTRDPEAVAEDGAYLAARWRGDGFARLAVVAAGGRARLFDVVWPNASTPRDADADPAALPDRCELILRATLTVGPGSIVGMIPTAADDLLDGGHRRMGSLPPMLSPVNEESAAPLNDGVCLSVAGDGDVLLLGTSTGHIVQCSWDARSSAAAGGGGSSHDVVSRGDPCADGGDHRHGAVIRLDYSTEMRAAAAVMSSGACALLRIDDAAVDGAGDPTTTARRTDDGFGFAAVVAERLRLERWVGEGDSTCASFSPPSLRTVAVGASTGAVRLYRVDAEPDYDVLIATPWRVLSPADWGYAPGDTGGCADVCWTSDGGGVAAGWWRRGVAAWSANGCRLMCTLPQGGGTAGSARGRGDPGPLGRGGRRGGGSRRRVGTALSRRRRFEPETFAGGRPTNARDREGGDGGTARLAWSGDGYRLFAASASGGGGVGGGGVGGGDGEARRAKKGRLREFLFAAACPGHHLDASTRRGARAHLLRAADRVIVVTGGDEDERAARHVMLPDAYAAPNWPLRLVAESADGRDLAAAGSRGLVLHDFKTGKWRFFGDVSHEREFVATALAWLEGGVIAVCTRLRGSGGGGGSWFDWGGSSKDTEAERHVLRMYPRNHLSVTSVLLEHELATEPVAMSALGRFLLVATPTDSGNLDVVVFEVALIGDMTGPRGGGMARVRPVRRVTLRDANVTGRVKELALLPAMPPRPDSTSPTTMRARASAPANGGSIGSPRSGALGLGPPPTPSPPPVPAHFMMLRVDGTLSLIDLGADESEGWTSERVLADGVERFWITSGGGGPAPNCDADVRWSWWTYGREGTRVWYVPVTGVPTFPAPSHGGGGDSVAFADPELEFDKEAYPLGISLGVGAPLIVGATQRLAFASCSDQPCFEPTPKVQPILPCILRHLLRLGEMGAAIGAARAAAGKPRFTHSLEWLLFSSLDRHAGPNSVANKKDPDAAKEAERALADAVRLCREFPEYPDVVVSVARKTDSREWPALFKHAGDPALLQANALAAGQLRTAACYLLVVDKLVSADVGAKAAGEVLRAALERRRYGLVGELVRFLARPAVEAAAARAARRSAEKKKRRGDDADEDVGIVFGLFRWLGAAPEPAKSEPADSAGLSPRRSLDEEFVQTPKGVEHVSGARGGVIAVLQPDLRRALRDHAAALAAAVDLGALAAFARETDFDVGAFFQRELSDVPGGGAARLGDFPRALAAAADSLRRHEQRAGGWPEVAAMRAGVDAMLAKMVAAGSSGVEWSLVTATLTRRVDVLDEIFDGRDEVLGAWRVAVERCAGAANARGDTAHAAFLQSLREEMCGQSLKV